ncbi:MAG: carboxypeptidase regulatory-like domain-containing protein [Solirubrobacteraceae bacterium]
MSPVTVVSGSLTTANGELVEVDGKVSGKVTSAGAPLKNAFVCAFGSGFGCATTNAGGEYTIEHLPPGSYKVEFSPGEVCKVICRPGGDYVFQYYNNQLLVENANVVSVKTGETTTGINADLQAGGHISGKVTNASIYAQPIASVVVCAKPTITNKAGEREGESICALANAGGEYTIEALASGGYEVEFRGEVCVEEKGASKCTHPYINQYYQSIVSVSAPGTTPGINGSLMEGAPTKPANTVVPTITQAVNTGSETLTCSTGSWSHNPTSLSYRWLRNGSAIAGQAANTYITQSTDAGTGIACEVTASNAAGSAASTSSVVQIPKPTPGVAKFKSASVKGSTVSVTLRCTGASACSGTVKIIVRVMSLHGKHKKTTSVTIGSGKFSMALGKTATAVVHLTVKGSKLLAHATKKGLKVQISGSGLTAHATTLKPSKRH